MSTTFEQLAANVARWEARGRGQLLYEGLVDPRPPFEPFPRHRLISKTPPDHGQRPTFLSRLVGKVSAPLQISGGNALALPEPQQEPEPHWMEEPEENLSEIRLLLPADLTISSEGMGHFLASISLALYPITLELIGVEGQAWLQLAVFPQDLRLVTAQLKAHFPEVILQETSTSLASAWGPMDDDSERLVLEFGLAHPFMQSLASPGKADPFVGLVGALSTLQAEEAGIYQVTFTPLTEPWTENVMAALTWPDGKPFFEDGVDLLKAAREKTSQPLYGVIVRLAARAADLDRVWEIVRRMAASLRLFSKPGGNELMPLRNDHYDDVDHALDFAYRCSRRCGMILNLSELIGFIRWPGAAVRSASFIRLDAGTRSVATAGPVRDGVCLGFNQHAGSASEVWLSPDQRVRHLHIIGASGSGKTTLMFNLMEQDAESGTGFALLDPHGDLVDRVMEIIPPHRRKDVVLVDPSDEQYIVPFNFLSAHSDFEKTLLASDLVAIFRAQSTSWGDQMNSVFGNAIRAFLESREGGTLADVRKFLLDPSWRDQFLKTVEDPDVVFYWQKGFPQLGGNKSIGPILTRLETFLSPKPIRYMVSQRENRLDFADMMDHGKIFLARLPQGQMGKENSHLLGALIIAKLQQMAMSRQRLDAKKRRPFFVYADEFQNFICPSMAEILSGARKYGLGFILAHQDLRQLDRDKDVASAVLSNAYTRVVFRVSDSDARSLADGFAHFPASELQNLPIGAAICRVERADNDFNLKVPFYDDPDSEAAAICRQAVIDSSRVRVARSRAEIETEIRRSTSPSESEPIAKDSSSKSHVPDLEPVGSSSVSEPKPEAKSPIFNSPSQEEKTLVEGTDADPGKGGHQHRLLQERIKAVGEAQGFRVTLEHPCESGLGSIDLLLQRPYFRIACEVSVSTTIDHEVGNARKCLKEEVTLIAMITGDERRRQQLEKAINDHFPPADRAKIRCYSPDDFETFLTGLPDSEGASSASGPKTVRGWKVTRKYTNLTPEERAAKTKAAFALLQQEMRD